MPLDDGFRLLLRRLSVETDLKVRDEEEEYKSRVVFEAQNKDNSAALPLAYANAKLHAFKNRVGQTIERYFSALGNCGIKVDDEVEKEMLKLFSQLTSGSTSLMFPPAIRGERVVGVRISHAREIRREGYLLYREAANRLLEAKIKARLRAEAEARLSGTSSANAPAIEKSSKKHTSSDPMLSKYRSEFKRAILIQLTKTRNASDLEICKAIDIDGAAELPETWKSKTDSWFFAEAYKDPVLRRRIEITISKIRVDLRKRGLL